LREKEFPCVAAKAALSKDNIQCMVATHMGCPKDDLAILQFLYSFVDDYRQSGEMYHSAAVIFQQPTFLTEAIFDEFLWQRLQSLSSMDAANFSYDARVDFDPSSPRFSYSLKEEAFFIIGLHPGSSRATRQFKYPTLVFNPHRQFEQLKETTKYQSLQHVVRKRDIAYSGSVNPMLQDFGAASEVYQYSGRRYDEQWQCPLKINHVPS
ncbi:MAG: YqcI/YcgG family protein, partial [Bacteroidota bacterium]|nr:YqcI/YcgG family protein [Bacteroidota bacterium]